jgi:endonuclease/exonuclease/phosphatase family metal-dependent hydrolase
MTRMFSHLTRFLRSTTRPRKQAARLLQCELLEDRTVPSTLRMATYNIEADINGVTTPRPGLFEVLEGIGEEQLQGHNQALDIVTLQETTSNTTTVDPIVSALNSFYSGIATYARSPYQATQSGSNSFGNGPNALIYNSSTLNLLDSVGVGTPQGSSNGEYRQVARYELQPVNDTGSTGIFYLYVSHFKAGTGSTNATYRNEEAQIIRNDEASLPADARVLYTGDFNLDASTDAAYQTLAAATSPGGVPQGAGFDPLNRPGNWALNSSFQDILTESSTDLRYRDDFLLVTQNINTAAAGGLSYVQGSYHTFGVNGTTPVYGTVNSGSNTSFNGNLVQNGPSFISGSTLLSDLTTASDHLPVVADFTIPDGGQGTPTIGSFTVSPSSVTVGATVTLTASNVSESGGTIAAVSFYRESNGTAGLQVGSDTLVGAGAQNGTTWTLANVSTTGLTAGTYTYYAVATDASNVSSTPSNATLTVTNPVSNGAVLAWEVNGQTNFGTQGLAASTVAAGITNSQGLTRGSGVATNNTAANNAWGGHGWASTSSAGISGNKFVTFAFTVSAGETASLSALDLHYRRSSTGPNSAFWQFQVNSGAWTTIGDFSNAFSSPSTSGADMTELNLSSVAGLQNLAAGNVVTLRLVPYGATSSAGTWYVYNHTGNDLVVTGSISGSGGMAPAHLAPAGTTQTSAPTSSSPSGAGKSLTAPTVSAGPGAPGSPNHAPSTPAPKSASIVDLGFDPFADLI